jgi:hypothetical protein
MADTTLSPGAPAEVEDPVHCTPDGNGLHRIVMMMRLSHQHHAKYKCPESLQEAQAEHKRLWVENAALRTELQELTDRADGAVCRAERLGLSTWA